MMLQDRYTAINLNMDGCSIITLLGMVLLKLCPLLVFSEYYTSKILIFAHVGVDHSRINYTYTNTYTHSHTHTHNKYICHILLHFSVVIGVPRQYYPVYCSPTRVAYNITIMPILVISSFLDGLACFPPSKNHLPLK